MRKILLPLLLLIAVSLFAQKTQKPVIMGKNWVAVTGKPMAATAGAQIFMKGGNAVDAAVAVGLALIDPRTLALNRSWQLFF